MTKGISGYRMDPAVVTQAVDAVDRETRRLSSVKQTIEDGFADAVAAVKVPGIQQALSRVLEADVEPGLREATARCANAVTATRLVIQAYETGDRSMVAESVRELRKDPFSGASDAMFKAPATAGGR